jgi:hypothetical protein
MNHYLLIDHWGSLVRDFKDAEKRKGISLYETEQMSRAILDYITYTRFRQYKLFIQKRGEEYEKMFQILIEKGYERESIDRFVENEELWKLTIELAELV